MQTPCALLPRCPAVAFDAAKRLSLAGLFLAAAMGDLSPRADAQPSPASLLLNPPLSSVATGPAAGDEQAGARQTPLIEPSPAEPSPVERMKAERQALAEKLRVAQRTTEGAADQPQPAAGAAQREIELLKRHDVIVAQQVEAAQYAKELEQNRQSLVEELDTLKTRGPTEPKPYNFSLLESLTNTLAMGRERLSTDSAAIKAATTRRDRAKEDANLREAERRQAKEATEQTKETAKAAELKLAELESDLAQAVLKLRRAELANLETSREVQNLQIDLLEEKIRWIEPHVEFTEEELKDRQLDLQRQEEALKRKIQLGEADQRFADRQWTDARARLESMTEPDIATTAEVERWRAAQAMLQRRARLWTKQLEWLGLTREAWRNRYRLESVPLGSEELRTIESRLKDALTTLYADRLLLDQELTDTRKELAALQAKREAAEREESPALRWLRDHQRVLQAELDDENVQLAKLEEVTRLYQSLEEVVGEKTQRFSLTATLQKVRDRIAGYWNFEILSSGEDSVTVGKVVLGVLLLGAGLFLSRRVSRGLGSRVLPRLGVESGPASALETLTFYALMLVSALLALRLVNVPLTVFTFLGGAVAIGVGFGSQNIINNFISGLILLTERPVRVGDVIEYNEFTGTVKAIGMRSTRMLTGSNLEIIVPNSALLENNVTNWTLADTMVRSCVQVGVAYGSPTRDVAKWLRHAADNHGLVLKKPEPFVWFAGFGESSLDFELHLYVKVRTIMERRTIESDIRFMVDGLLREAGITIAFPQRDVHLTTLEPLEVRVVSEPEAPQGARPGSGGKLGEKAA